MKGEEYDNVLIVIGRGWNQYKFEDTLYQDESRLTDKQLKVYERNRNLFYVCCSRPRKRLALLVTVPINDQFKRYLGHTFGIQNVISYGDFISH